VRLAGQPRDQRLVDLQLATSTDGFAPTPLETGRADSLTRASKVWSYDQPS
jgi:hypothetical protein